MQSVKVKSLQLIGFGFLQNQSNARSLTCITILLATHFTTLCMNPAGKNLLKVSQGLCSSVIFLTLNMYLPAGKGWKTSFYIYIQLEITACNEARNYWTRGCLRKACSLPSRQIPVQSQKNNARCSSVILLTLRMFLPAGLVFHGLSLETKYFRGIYE